MQMPRLESLYSRVLLNRNDSDFAMVCRQMDTVTSQLRPISYAALCDAMSGAEDPYRWLEDSASLRTREWVTRQQTQARGYFGTCAARGSITAKLTRLMDTEA